MAGGTVGRAPIGPGAQGLGLAEAPHRGHARLGRSPDRLDGHVSGLWTSMRYRTDLARRLRHQPTAAEKAFWRRIRRRQLDGWKFRRQLPIAGYVVDFCCPSAGVIVEIDGGQHADNPRDDARRAALEAAGYRVLRYWNNEVLGNIDGVLADLRRELAKVSERKAD